MKKQLIILLILSSLVACSSNSNSQISSASNFSSETTSSSEPISSSEPTEPIEITINPIQDGFKPHSELVRNYFLSLNYDYKDMDPHVNAKIDQGDNLPIEITWEAKNVPSNKQVEYIVMYTDGDKAITDVTSEQKYDLINYKLNTFYNVNVAARVDGGEPEGLAEYRFKTPDGYVRTVTIDGVNNFRDLGDGKKIKQGLIYRSSTLTNNTAIDEDHPASITEKGKVQLSRLGINTRIDLRKPEEIAESEENVTAFVRNYPLYYGGQNILTYVGGEFNNPENIKSIFNDLGDRGNYPLDIHCVRGTDRTGCIAYLIKGLMGVDEDMIYRDFLFSDFYNIGSPVKLESIYYEANPNAVTRYVNVIKQTEGATLKDKIFNYLTSNKVGVPADALNNMMAILRA